MTGVLAPAVPDRPWRTIGDTARVRASYCAAIVVRTYDQRDAQELAQSASVGDLRGVRLTYVGDGNNVAHSLMEAGAGDDAQVDDRLPTEQAMLDVLMSGDRGAA